MSFHQCAICGAQIREVDEAAHDRWHAATTEYTYDSETASATFTVPRDGVLSMPSNFQADLNGEQVPLASGGLPLAWAMSSTRRRVFVVTGVVVIIHFPRIEVPA